MTPRPKRTRTSAPKRPARQRSAAPPKQQEQPAPLPPEVIVPDAHAKRRALITVIGIVVVMGIVGAVIELVIPPLFAPDANADLTLETRHSAHAPVTSELDFLIQMVPHHQEAIDSSRIIAASSENAALTTLAQDIIEAQRAEIAQMNAWIDAWYPGERYEDSYEPMMPDLTRLSGKARDDAYLLGMIAHHEMAVAMAREVQALNPRPEVQALADLIIRTQTDEIHAMQDLLGYMPVDGAMHAGHH